MTKERSTKHYTENYISSNNEPTIKIGVNSGAPEEWVVSVPLLVPSVLLLLQTG
jgi:hypothetical protein